ncbi:MAG: hypothetical protein WCD37_12845 [Chloroflexia bacterium]
MSTQSSRPLAISTLSAFLLTILFAALSAMPPVSLASPAAQAQPQSVTIPAGSTATIKVRGFCLNFGKPFPTGNMTMDGLASDTTRKALSYAIQKGYTDNNAAQVQEAIWFLQDNTWHSQDHTIGQEIVDNASTVSTIPIGSGTALNDPAAQNVLTMTALFVPQTPDAFYGDGDLQIKNTGSTEIRVYLPIGAKFVVPNNNGGFQDLVAYALQPAGTPTAPAATPMTASTPAVASTATSAATATVEATSTLAPAPELFTPVPTQTQMPVATPTAEAAAPLPGTGSAEDALLLALVLVALGFGLAALGLVVRLRTRS